MSLYDDLKAAGIETDSHESDLYVKDSPEARAILAKHGKNVDGWNVQLFTSAIDGDHWLDLPFSYSPFWDAVDSIVDRVRRAGL